mmetsp:Transcript_2039/g.8117  ORF Transcript_2039/g.8117 Transcript_2039/m.8117 type:complete len:214 (+) Transcript_2039:502-1143(+)
MARARSDLPAAITSAWRGMTPSPSAAQCSATNAAMVPARMSSASAASGPAAASAASTAPASDAAASTCCVETRSRMASSTSGMSSYTTRSMSGSITANFLKRPRRRLTEISAMYTRREREGCDGGCAGAPPPPPSSPAPAAETCASGMPSTIQRPCMRSKSPSTSLKRSSCRSCRVGASDDALPLPEAEGGSFSISIRSSTAFARSAAYGENL